MRELYQHIGRCKAVSGSVLEIGLGWGYSADHIMNNSMCRSLDSYEIDPDAVVTFHEGHEQDGRHTILEVDFFTHDNPNLYDFIYIDVVYANDPAQVDMCMSMVERAFTLLEDTGKLAVEFWADCSEERRLRAWLELNYTREYEHVPHKMGEGARSGIVYWTVK